MDDVECCDATWTSSDDGMDTGWLGVHVDGVAVDSLLDLMLVDAFFFFAGMSV